MVFTTQRIRFILARKSFFFEKSFLLISVMVSTSSKIAQTKKILFPPGRESVCTSWMEELKNAVNNAVKNLLPLVGVDCCLSKWKNVVSASQKISF